VSKSLSYIPGAKFLGVVASQLYDEKNQDTLALFHSGQVRFGDAHPRAEGATVTMVPASWHVPKGREEDGPVYLHHKLSADRKAKLIATEKIQLKRAKDFYVAEGPNGEHQQLKVAQRFSLKTAFNAEERRSKEGQLFGYYVIPAGSIWQFNVDLDDEAHADLIDQHLTGQRRIGRSRSAQYGLVQVEAAGRTTINDGILIEGEVTLLAHGNLAFYDENGLPTVRPTPEQLKLPPGSKVLWDQSRIRYRRYATRNAKRRSNDPDRLIITKGSVISVSLAAPLNTSVWLKGVGAHQAEGFGQLIVNPATLHEAAGREGEWDGPALNVLAVKKEHLSYPVEKGEGDDLVAAFLTGKAAERERELKVLIAVNEFIGKHIGSSADYENVNNSQWGQIRQLARRYPVYRELNENLFDEKKGQLYAGQSQSVWRKQGRGQKVMAAAEDLPEELRVAFLQKLAAEMPKIKPSKNQAR
jgi:hypothetical protein